MITRKISLFVIICLCTAVSCAKREVVERPPFEPYAGPVTVETLKQAIAFRNISSVKALADVRVFRKGEHEGSFSGIFGYRAPQSLRMSLFGPFGLTVMDFLVSDRLLQMYLPPKNILYEWESDYIPLFAFLDGRFTYILRENDTDYELQARPLDGADEEIAARFIFDKTYLKNTAAVFYKNGLEFARADFVEFNGNIPGRTVISFRNRTRLELTLSEAELGTEIPDEYFRPVDNDGKKVRPFQDVLKRLDPNR